MHFFKKKKKKKKRLERNQYLAVVCIIAKTDEQSEIDSS